MDFTSYSDQMLDTLRIEVLTEQERRTRAAELPGQIAGLAREAVAAGTAPHILIDAVREAITPDQPATSGPDQGDTPS